MSDCQPVSALLRAWMDRHDLTYDAAAPLIGTSRRTLASLLRGESSTLSKPIRLLLEERERRESLERKLRDLLTDQQ